MAGARVALLLFYTGAALVPELDAQRVVSARAGLISYVQGPVFIDSKRVVLKLTRFPQMLPGQTLSTGRGRAELLLSPGVVLRLAENSQVHLDDAQLADTRVTLLRGDALIEVVQLSEGNRIQIEVAGTTIEPTRSGLYRIGTSQNGTVPGNLRVYGGEALVRSGAKTATLKRGMAAVLNAELPVARFDRKQTDSLHAWAARRSFELFMSDADTRERQSHWQFAGGYAENKNFGVVFRAAVRRRAPPPALGPSVPRAESSSARGHSDP